jgi:DNA-binding GntR family transcriptional regulator
MLTDMAACKSGAMEISDARLRASCRFARERGLPPRVPRSFSMTDARVSPVDLSTLQERVYQELRAALFRGRFAPGETLTIRTLAQAMGTSEMPVREALQRLTAEKVLQQIPGRSIQVTPVTHERHDELTRIRMSVEGLAAKLAAPRADALLILQLKKFNFEMGDAAAAKDWLRALQSNQEFHFAIYRAAKSAQLFEIIESLWLRTGPFLAVAYRGPQKPEEMFLRGMQVHERIIAALDRRDGKAAMHGVMLDIKSANSWYRRYCDFAVAS